MAIEEILLNLIFFLVVFLLVFIVDFYFISTKKQGKKRVDKLTSEADFIISRYNLDDKKVNLRKLNFHISVINGFIISFVSTTISLINVNISIQFLIGFILLFALIYSVYEIYGRYMNKKIGKKKE